MIVSDIIRTIRQPQYFEYDYLVKDSKESEVRSFDQEENSYFLRIQQEEKQDNRNRIEVILAKNNISIEDISEVTDKENRFMIGFLTARLQEEIINKALKEIGQQISCAKVENCIKVYHSTR